MAYEANRMIAAAREIRRESQRDLAERCAELSGDPSWNRNVINSIENGRRGFTVDALLLIAKAQDMPLDWYLDTDGVMLSEDVPGLLESLAEGHGDAPLAVSAAA